MKPRMTVSMLVLRRLLRPSLLGLVMLVFVMGLVTLNQPLTAQAAPNDAPRQQGAVFTLTVLHTNDMHAHIDQYQASGAACAFVTATNCIGGAARLMTKINEFRAATSNTLLVDAGDQFQGTLFYNLFKSDIVTRTMNALEYDAMAIGNHEFDDQSPMLETLLDGANFPVLSADINNPNIPAGKIKPSMIITVNGEAIGVIGLTTPETEFTSSPEANVVFSDTVTTLQAEIDKFTTQGVNKIVALTHLGYVEDQALARAVRGVDVIVGGHSHTFIYTLVGTNTVHPESGDKPEGPYPTQVTDLDGNQVLVVTAGSWGRYLGHLDVGFDAAGKVVSSAGEPLYMKSAIAKDPTVEAIVAGYRPQVEVLRNTNIGTSTVDMPVLVAGAQVCRLGECVMGNMVTDAMLWRINQVNPDDQYQIAIQNGGGLRTPINVGNISMGEVLEVLPFGNTIATLSLTGTHIISAIENGLSNSSPIPTGSVGRFPQISGMHFTWDAHKPAFSRVLSVTVLSGTTYVPINPNAVYKVATNNFMRTGGDGYSIFLQGIDPYDFGPSLDQAVADYIQAQPNKTISTAIEGRIEKTKIFTLTVLHTNDMHAHIDQYQASGAACAFVTSTNCIAGAARLMTKIQEFRTATSNTLLLDAGDQFQGTLFYNLFKSDIVTRTMNALKYDAMAIGNHEFDDQSPMLETLLDGANFPVLSADIDNPNIPAGKIKPSMIITVNGEAIGVIGLTTPETKFTSSPEANVVFSDTVVSLQTQIDKFTTQGINRIIALTHLGYVEDQALARAVRGVDVIVGGHSHTFIYTLVGTNTVHPESGDRPEGPYPTKVTDLDGNPVLVVTAASWGRYLGHLDVGFDETGKVVSSAGEPIYMKSNIAKDPTVEAIVASYRPQVEVLRNTIIGTSTVNMPVSVAGAQVCRLGECLMGNFVADAILWGINQVNPDDQYQIAIQNGGGLRTPIDVGSISTGEVMEVLPFGNTIATLSLTGTHVISAIENGLSTLGTGNIGRFPQISGMHFTWDPNKPPFSRVLTVTVLSGTTYIPLDPDAIYKVATNNFMRLGGDGYTIFLQGIDPYDFGPPLDQVVINYIKQLPDTTVSPVIEGRIIAQVGSTTIPAIQGLTNTSPISGQTVEVEGTVVGDFQNSTELSGFFMQAFPGDGNPATSDGIFVNSGLVNVAVGDLVQVTGIVEEAGGLTRLNFITGIDKLSSGNAVTATAVTLPVSSTTAMEMYEGMLVQMPQTLYVTEHFQLGRFGEVVLSLNGRQMIPTHVAAPGAAAQAVQTANNLARIVLDDGSGVQNPPVISYPPPGLSASNTVRGGDEVSNLTGILSYGASAYRLQPTITPTFTVANPRPAAPVTVNGSLKVVGFNTLNYFVTLGSRGATTTLELQRQRDKLVPAIIGTGADIVGLMEIENHPTNDALTDLVNSLNAVAGADTYMAITDPAAGLGTDAIKVSMIYKPAKVTPVGVAQTIITGVFAVNTLPPLAQTFKDNATGEMLTVVANHFKSKSSCPTAGDPNADSGDGQGCWNADRVQAANILADWLATDPTGSHDPDMLIIGDLNAYAMEDPITALKDKGYVNLIQDKLGDEAYSYVFGGQWGYLDHAMASHSLASQVTDLAEWHINADEPPVLDYNIEFKTPAQQDSLYAPNAYRASDHDPVIVGFDLKPREVVSTTPKLVPIGAGYKLKTLELFAQQAIHHNQDNIVKLLVLPIAYNEEAYESEPDGDPYTISDAYREENMGLALGRAAEIAAACTGLITPTQCIALVPDIQIRSDAFITENIAMFSNDVDGIYTLGGDQLVAMMTVANTPVEERMEALYKMGVVVGGNSAGAAIQSRYMIGGYLGDFGPQNGLQSGALDLWYGTPDTITRGLRFGLDKAIVDQHILERGRIARLLQAAQHSPGPKVGVGVDYGTGSVIENSEIVTGTAGSYTTVILDEEVYGSAAQAKYLGPNQTLSIKNVAMHLLPPGGYGYNLNSHRPIVNGVVDANPPSVAGRKFDMLKAPAGAGVLMVSGNLEGMLDGQVAQRFASLALATGKPTFIVAAGFVSTTAAASAIDQEMLLVTNYGITHVQTAIVMMDSNVAAIATQLETAGAIFFVGGEQDVLASQLTQIQALKLDQRWKNGTHLLMQDGAAALVGSWMSAASRPDHFDDNVDNFLEYQSSDSFWKDYVNIQPGLGLIANAAFEPQVLVDYRYGRLVSLVQADRNVVAFGLDEGTALEITPVGAQAWGPSAVMVLDGRQAGMLGVGTNDAFAATWLLLDTYTHGEVVYGQAAVAPKLEAFLLLVPTLPYTLNMADGALTVTWPANTLPNDALRFVYTHLLSPTMPLPVNGVGRYFNLNLFNTSGQEITGTLANTMTFVVSYDPTQLGGLDENKLSVIYYDVLAQKWKPIPIVSRDLQANTITIQVNHLTEFAVTDELIATNDTYFPIIIGK